MHRLLPHRRGRFGLLQPLQALAHLCRQLRRTGGIGGACG
jgi:hypothetical protein